MGVIVRKPSAASGWVTRRARQLGAQLLAAGGGMKRAVLDGYMVLATARKKTAVVHVLDVPFQIAMCQPYLVEWPQGAGNTIVSVWRRLDIRQGRDPIEVEAYRTLDIGSDIVTAQDMRYIWSYGYLPIGDAPTEGTSTYARGTFNVSPGGDAITAASVLGAAGAQWVLVARINAFQSMLPLTADAGVEPRATEQRVSNVLVSAASLGVALRPPTGDALTVTPSAVAHDGVGVLCANTFTANPAPGLFDTAYRVGAVVARYQVTGDFDAATYPEQDARTAALTWSAVIDTQALPAPLTGGNVHLTRLATAQDGAGVFAAVVRKVVEWDDNGTPRGDVVRGLITAEVTASGIGAATVVEVGALFAGDDTEVFTNTPIVGVNGASGPAIICHRVRETRAGDDRLRPGAEDIGLSVVTAGARTVVDTGDYLPITYTPRDEVMTGGRITTGLWDYPLDTGTWTVFHVQSACQCGPDELAVLVRPKAKFADATTDIHVAIVRISTGELITVGPGVLRGSLYMHASVTCWQHGVWADGVELSPARLLISLFREAGAPAEVEQIVRGTYRSLDSGRTTKLLVATGSTLSYAMGSPLKATIIGGQRGVDG